MYEPVLTFWQSDPKCRLMGNLNGPMKNGVGPGCPTLWQFHRITFLAVYMDDVHVRLGFSIGRYSQVAGTTFLLIVS